MPFASVVVRSHYFWKLKEENHNELAEMMKIPNSWQLTLLQFSRNFISMFLNPLVRRFITNES